MSARRSAPPFRGGILCAAACDSHPINNCIMINPACTGTMDPVVSKMLYMHAPSLSPGAFLELELSPMVQSAALLGLGLLFRGSCHRYYRSSWYCMEFHPVGEAVASGFQGVFSPAPGM